MQNEFRHFNPAKFNLQVKVSKVRSSSHAKHNINYHFIWIPKYRKKLLVEPIVNVLRSIILGQCQELKVEPLALEIMPDHIHLFVSATPTHTPFEIIQKIAATYHAWRGEGGKYEDVKGFCKSAKLDDIRKHEHILTPGRYVGAEDVEEDMEQFDEKMRKLTAELKEQFKKSKELEEEIKKNLRSIGWRI